jgi:TPR repeat protein
MANLTIQPPPPPPPPLSQPTLAALPSLTASLPVLAQLQSAASAVQLPTHDPALKVDWCRDVFFLVDRAHRQSAPGTDPPVGPVTITDPTLLRLAQIAVPLVLQLSQSYNPSQGKIPPFIAEAISMRATLAATGAFPDYVRLNPRNAFRDFESAARGGYPAAWFRLGRDYENFNDHQHARDCFERGVRLNVESCLYRMGMAHLLGQLSLQQNITAALPLLHRAATLATLQVPQPAYVYALLLLSEFTQITVPPILFGPLIPPNSSPTLEARKHLERAAYLHFPAAQYKLGHAYEFAEPPFPFDPLLSVQYYSLASEQGESEADMALSKWFLCGSNGAAGAPGGGEGGFDKDEALALTFADKAAKKGLPSAEFAMGYYAEVGVGRPKDIKTALGWYQLVRFLFSSSLSLS